MQVEGIRITVAHPTHPRIDIVVKKGDETRVLVGIPTVGANLRNRLGCAAAPEGWEVDTYVLVSASATEILEANVMPNVWTSGLDAAVARIEDELREDQAGGDG